MSFVCQRKIKLSSVFNDNNDNVSQCNGQVSLILHSRTVGLSLAKHCLDVRR